MYYIEEIDKPNRILRNFKIIKLEDNKIILPIIEEELSEKYQQKLANKTH